jgi:cytochrome c oxidase subunit 2
MTPTALDLLPAAASTTGATIDRIAAIVFAVTGLVTLGVFVAMLLLVLRNRRGPGRPRGEEPRRVLLLELGWTSLTGLVFMGFFVLGVLGHDALLRAPADPDAVDILVLGKRWMWEFQQPNGRRELETLHVPAGRVVRLHLDSEDVIHSFYVPAFRLKHDVVPGMVQSLWFEATTPGTYRLHCAEYCGTDHARMTGTIVVLEPLAYDAWLERREGDGPPLAIAGRAVFERYGCVACHETGRNRRAPPLVGVYGRLVTLQGGAIVRADDDYLRRAILRPAEQIVADYEAGVMPSYEGILRDDELLLLLAYLRALGDAEGTAR